MINECCLHIFIGTDRLRPLVIGHSARPRSFPSADDSRRDPVNRPPVQGYGGLCFYYSNDSAWMSQKIFDDWLTKLNSLMLHRNKKILLLVDNCRPHYVNKLSRSNVHVEFLPKNTTSFLQPMDQGIIRSWKAYYRRAWVNWRLAEFGAGRYESNLDIYNAIMMACRAWSQVKSSTFSNCWIKTGIVPGTALDEVNEANVAIRVDNTREQEDVHLLLTKTFQDLHFNDEEVDEFICDPDEEKDGYEIPSMKEILTDMGLISINEPPERLVKDIEPKVFTLQEARSGAEAILGFLKNQPECPLAARGINDVISYLDLQRVERLKQQKLFFAPLTSKNTA